MLRSKDISSEIRNRTVSLAYRYIQELRETQPENSRKLARSIGGMGSEIKERILQGIYEIAESHVEDKSAELAVQAYDAASRFESEMLGITGRIDQWNPEDETVRRTG